MPTESVSADRLRRFLELAIPPEQVALEPPPDRAGGRLLVAERESGGLTSTWLQQLPDWARPGDLWVLNRSRVRPGLLHLYKDSGGRVELLFLGPEPASDGAFGNRSIWRAMGETRKLRPGMSLAGPAQARFEVCALAGREAVVSVPEGDFEAWLDAHGQVPLPPYIRRGRGRDRPPAEADRSRYQTVYARERGSIAAPTAGLHFTPELMAAMQVAGARFAEVLLHVGPATFTEVDPDMADRVRVAPERAEIPPETLEALAETRSRGGRVIPVGTTSLRTLESLLPEGGLPAGVSGAVSGMADRTLRPGAVLHWADALLTNFHMPRTSLRLLVAAVAGTDLALQAYERALADPEWRFFSYGDAMLIV